MAGGGNYRHDLLRDNRAEGDVPRKKEGEMMDAIWQIPLGAMLSVLTVYLWKMMREEDSR